MEVFDKHKCCKCKNEKEPDKHKYCSKCREYFREYHYKNRDKKNEQRKLNRLKNIEHDKAWHTHKNITKITVIKYMKKRRNTTKTICNLKCFVIIASVQWKNVGSVDIYKQRSIKTMKR